MFSRYARGARTPGGSSSSEEVDDGDPRDTDATLG